MLNKGLHWSTVASEKVLLAGIGGLTIVASGEYMYGMWQAKEILLSDLFMLFIFVEIIGMFGAF